MHDKNSNSASQQVDVLTKRVHKRSPEPSREILNLHTTSGHLTLTLLLMHLLLTIINDFSTEEPKLYRQYTTSVLLVTESIHDSGDRTSPLVFAFPISMLFQ